MHLNLRNILFLCCLLAGLSTTAKAQFYTGSNNTFGKNRVQFNPSFWQSYHFERFKVYFVGSGQQHAVYTAKSAHKFLQEVEAFLDYNITDEIQFVVFNSQSAFRQSNIGLTNDDETNIGGVTRVDGNKIFVYYEGDHQKLDEQIRSGIANMVVHKMMYGDNWKESLKSSTLLTFPDWFLKGFVAYMEGDWNTELDNKVKDGILSGNYSKFNRLEGEDAELAGRAIWNYIDEVYGRKMIPNILYMTRVSRNIESGFLYVLGTSLKNLSHDFVAYYRERYNKDDLFRIEPSDQELRIKTKKTRKYQQYRLSPDGKYAAFVSNELGQYKVWLYDIEKNEPKEVKRFDAYEQKKAAYDKKQTDKQRQNPEYSPKTYKAYKPKYYRSKKIAKGDHKLDRLPDYSHPVLAWHPTGEVLAFIEEKKGELILNLYDLEEKKSYDKPLMKLEKVLDMSYSNDGKKIIMSAVAKGQTDIYLYNVIGNNQKQLTNDFYDDLHPRFIDNSTRVIFSSNRNDDTIRKKTEIEMNRYDKDIFILDIEKPKYPLTRITNTPFVDESYPNQYDEKHYSYVSNENGINNRYLAYYDSAISHIDTAIHYRYFSVTGRLSNYSRDVIEYDPTVKSDAFAMLMRKQGKFRFYRGKQANDKMMEDELVPTRFMKYRLNSLRDPIVETISTEEIKEAKDSNAVDINNYRFDDEIIEFEKVVIKMEREDQKDTTIIKEDTIEFELPRKQIYDINFTTNYIVSQVDNSFLNQSYQRYTGGGYQNPGFNGLIKMGMIDLFEDYRVIGGFRFPVNFDNTEYMLSFENLKSRLDKKYLVSRQSFSRVQNGEVQKIQTYDLKHNIRYPFSEVASLRLTGNLRYDRLVTLSTEPSTLEKENENHYMGGVKLEYVYDNTRSLGLNLPQGMRFKLWGEAYHELDQKETDFFVFGLDWRHYLRIHRSIIFASRIAASTSIGSQRLLYYMGGVDSWLGTQFDASVIPDPNQNYQFQTIATPVRGFYQNARNGNSMALINNELRVPVFKYLSGKPLKSDFLENFMVVGFGDIGTAWTGWNPYTSENSFNTTLVEGHNYLITLQNQKEPIIYGYGVGLRSRLFGYYVRFDWSWGVDDGVVLKGVKYLSLSLDF